MEQVGYNLLFCCLVGLAMDATTFSKNGDRLLDGDVAQHLLAAVVAQAWVKALMSDEHFSVDGMLIQVWASHKSFQPKPAYRQRPTSTWPERRAELARAQAQQLDLPQHHRSGRLARAQIEWIGRHPNRYRRG